MTTKDDPDMCDPALLEELRELQASPWTKAILADNKELRARCAQLLEWLLAARAEIARLKGDVVGTMNHTPWREKSEDSPVVVDARGRPVALVKLCADPDECRAIRDLVAATPELLEACEELLGLWDGSGEGHYLGGVSRRARAAIAKAKGNAHETDSDAGAMADPPAD